MKSRFVVAALFAAVLSACSATVPQRTEIEQRQSALLNATVRIEVAGGGFGSGTFIGRHHVITNFHVAGSNGTHVLRGWVVENEKTFPVTYEARVVASDEKRDLALLEIREEWPGLVAPLAVDSALYAGEPVWAAGAPLGKHINVTSGEVTLPLDDLEIEGVRHVMATAPVAPGNSGGGCWHINQQTGRYEMVAVTRAISVTQVGFGIALLPHMSLFIPITEVRAFLTSSGIAL